MGTRPQHAPAYHHLCALLRKWRDDAELTQRQLGARLRVTHSAISKAESGDRRVDPVELVLWCRACGIDPAKAIRELAERM